MTPLKIFAWVGAAHLFGACIYEINWLTVIALTQQHNNAFTPLTYSIYFQTLQTLSFITFPINIQIRDLQFKM